MARIVNFSPGPATLPEEVLQQAQAEMLNYRGLGLSVLEMSHRSSAFDNIIQQTEGSLRRLLAIPDDYSVLFLQGGASTQFAMIPMNLRRNRKADYINTGVWAGKAAEEAARFSDVHIAASSQDTNFDRIPNLDHITFRPDSDYVHICHNNTIYGTRFTSLPETGKLPLVGDYSSSLLSEPLDVNQFGLIYAGAQKNLGPAGVTIVIIRKDLIYNDVDPGVPIMLRYATHQKAASLYNTPPVYAIYLCGLVFEWLENLGGLPAIHKRNQQKAALLYDYLDHSRLFSGLAQKQHRSLMNIVFTTHDQQKDQAFVAQAQAQGLQGLAGYRSLGGMRASIYNAMPVAGVQTLVDFMEGFERDNP